MLLDTLLKLAGGGKLVSNCGCLFEAAYIKFGCYGYDAPNYCI